MRGLFKLKSKGMVLVFLPLVFQVVFVSILIVQLAHLQDALLKATSSRELIARANSVTSDVMSFATRVFFAQADRAIEEKDLRADVRRIKRPFDELIDLTERTANQAKNARGLKMASDHFLGLFEEVLDHKRRGWKHWESVSKTYDVKVETGIMTFLPQIEKISDVEMAKRSGAGFINEFKSSFAQITAAALVLSVIVSAGLGLAFAIGFRKPIEHISENTRRMSRRQGLLPPLSGSDELAELDRYIHTAASGIEQAFAKEQLMVEEAVDMICIIGADGRFRRVNPAALTLTGWKPEELLLQTVFDLIVAEDMTTADEEFIRAKQSGMRATFDLRMWRKNGQSCQTRWSCIYSTGNEEMFAVVHDVTAEKNVERLKQDFLDMITHDLRSPLTAMQGSLTLVAEGVRGEVSAAVRSEVNAATSKVEHLAALVNDLLDFQKLSAGKMSMVKDHHNLDQIIADSIGMLLDLGQAKGINIQAEPTGLSLYCDRSKVVQVMNNLIANAVKFSPDGSSVEIKCMLSNNVSSEAPGNSKWLEIHILDRGHGVPSHLHEKIFEAFERIPGERKEGTGLGLAICKMIVEAHGGTIGINGQSSGGDFWFKIPMISQADS